MNRRRLITLLLLAGAAAHPPQAAAGSGSSAPPPPPPVPTWRDMLREYLALAAAGVDALPPESTAYFKSFHPEMRLLGEAFVKTAYAPARIEIGRQNYTHLVLNLGMAHPTAGDLRQFLHPNKKPWRDYAGATDGQFHMLFNSGTLPLDTADGASKNHPAFALAKKHLSFWGRTARAKNIAKTLTATIRANAAFVVGLCANATARDAFLNHFRDEWRRRLPDEKPLAAGDIAFAAAMLRYTA